MTVGNKLKPGDTIKHKKGSVYVVRNINVLMRHPTNGVWFIAVDYVDINTGQVYVRSVNDFEKFEIVDETPATVQLQCPRTCLSVGGGESDDDCMLTSGRCARRPTEQECAKLDYIVQAAKAGMLELITCGEVRNRSVVLAVRDEAMHLPVALLMDTKLQRLLGQPNLDVTHITGDNRS